MSEHEATPEEQAQVRRLLAGARHDEPLPADVAARLDDVLAGLAGEGPAALEPVVQPPLAPVLDLAARRRRRAGALLLAAAAVVVAGVGLGQVVGTAGSDSGDSAEAPVAAEADSSDADGASGGNRTADDLTPGDAYPSSLGAPELAPEVDDAPTGLPGLTTANFTRKVTVLQQQRTGYVEPDATALVDGAELTSDPMYVCEPAEFGPGLLLAVRYNQVPAVLAFRPPTGSTQTVDLLQCGTATVLRSTSLPAP